MVVERVLLGKDCGPCWRKYVQNDIEITFKLLERQCVFYSTLYWNANVSKSKEQERQSLSCKTQI